MVYSVPGPPYIPGPGKREGPLEIFGPVRRSLGFAYRCSLVAALASLLPVSLAVGGTTPSDVGSSWWLNLRSTGYLTQTEDAAGDVVDRLRAFQHVSGTVSGLADGRLRLRVSGRFAGDLRDDPVGDETARLYTGYAEYRIDRRLRMVLGRQFLREGVAGLTLDGLRVTARPAHGLDVGLWGGAGAPRDRAFAAGDLSVGAAYGGRVAYAPRPGLRLAVSAAVRERGGETAQRPVGLELAASPRRDLRLAGRLDYDLELEDWGRMEAHARWAPASGRTALSVQLVDRRPLIDAASWFARFAELKRIRMARALLRHETERRLGGEIEYTGAYVDGRTSTRLGAALLLPDARLGYSLRLGAAGEESTLYGDLRRRLLTWLSVGAHASLVTYALFEDAPTAHERELTTLSARVEADLRPGLRLLAEVQNVRTPVYDEDVRLLLGLNVSMARGASRLGLGRGGGLR